MALTQFMIFREKLRGENQNTKFNIPFCICSGVLCVYVCVLVIERASVGFSKINSNQLPTITNFDELFTLASTKKKGCTIKNELIPYRE